MDKRAGEHGKFLSRVDFMMGREGGRSAHVITREDNGLVSLQVVSSRCSGNRASSDFLFVLCSECNHGFIQLLLFILVMGLPSEVTAILNNEGFTFLASLKQPLRMT